MYVNIAGVIFEVPDKLSAKQIDEYIDQKIEEIEEDEEPKEVEDAE